MKTINLTEWFNQNFKFAYPMTIFRSIFEIKIVYSNNKTITNILWIGSIKVNIKGNICQKRNKTQRSNQLLVSWILASINKYFFNNSDGCCDGFSGFEETLQIQDAG